MVGLKLGNIVVYEKDHSKLPCDGQRMIAYLERKFIDSITDVFADVFDSWMDKKFLYHLFDTFVRHTMKTGKMPSYISWKAVMTHDLKEHKRTFDLFDKFDEMFLGRKPDSPPSYKQCCHLKHH